MGKHSTADFTLLFTADGSVELLNRKEEVVWSSDNDGDFTEEFGGETFFSDEEDSENIIDYLDEHEIIDASEDEIDIVENDLEDETNGEDIIDADFEELEK